MFGRHAPHAANRAIDRLAAVRRQLFEILKELSGLLLLILRQMLPGFHAIEDAFLLLWRQTRKTLQPSLQLSLALRRKPAELRIFFQFAALFRWRQILVPAQPVAGVARLILRCTRIGIDRTGAAIFLETVPLAVGALRRKRALDLR